MDTLRSLLILGATAVLNAAKDKTNAVSKWALLWAVCGPLAAMWEFGRSLLIRLYTQEMLAAESEPPVRQRTPEPPDGGGR